MKKKDTSRRNFIRNGFVLGGAAVCLPETLFSANTSEQKEPLSKQKNLVFLFQGDSITDGNRGRSMDPNHIMGHGYAFSISSRIGADFPDQGYTFYNRGISGNKISDLSGRWQEDALILKPDVLSILVGINDANAALNSHDKNSNLQEFEETYRQLLKRSRTINPKMILVLGIPFVYPVGNIIKDWEFYNSDVSKRGAIILKLAKEFDAVVVDYKPVIDQAIKKMPADYWIWDGIHPTVFGHELMARLWITKVSERLKFLKFYPKGHY